MQPELTDTQRQLLDSTAWLAHDRGMPPLRALEACAQLTPASPADVEAVAAAIAAGVSTLPPPPRRTVCGHVGTQQQWQRELAQAQQAMHDYENGLPYAEVRAAAHFEAAIRLLQDQLAAMQHAPAEAPLAVAA